MDYKILTTNKGPRYMKGNRFVSQDKIPIDILERLGKQDKVNTSKDCIFCGVPSKLSRLLNLQPLYLCEEHFYDSTITLGKIAQKVREDGLQS